MFMIQQYVNSVQSCFEDVNSEEKSGNTFEKNSLLSV